MLVVMKVEKTAENWVFWKVVMLVVMLADKSVAVWVAMMVEKTME
jgi:hypothetical protein